MRGGCAGEPRAPLTARLGRVGAAYRISVATARGRRDAARAIVARRKFVAPPPTTRTMDSPFRTPMRRARARTASSLKRRRRRSTAALAALASRSPNSALMMSGERCTSRSCRPTRRCVRRVATATRWRRSTRRTTRFPQPHVRRRPRAAAPLAARRCGAAALAWRAGVHGREGDHRRGLRRAGVTTIASVLQSAVPGAVPAARGGIGKERAGPRSPPPARARRRRKKKGAGRQLNSTPSARAAAVGPIRAADVPAWSGWSQTGSCQVAWEASDRVASLSRDGRNLCVPFIIRHYFPAARVVLVLADPVERAVLQQSNWLYNRCWASARTTRARDDGAKAAKPKRAKNAARGCERFGASCEPATSGLECLRTCQLHSTPTLEKAMSCASTCSKALHASFPAECGVGGSCPYLTLPSSHCSLVRLCGCRHCRGDQLLILQRGQLFEEREIHAAPPRRSVFSPFARAMRRRPSRKAGGRWAVPCASSAPCGPAARSSSCSRCPRGRRSRRAQPDRREIAPRAPMTSGGEPFEAALEISSARTTAVLHRAVAPEALKAQDGRPVGALLYRLRNAFTARAESHVMAAAASRNSLCVNDAQLDSRDMSSLQRVGRTARALLGAAGRQARAPPPRGAPTARSETLEPASRLAAAAWRRSWPPRGTAESRHRQVLLVERRLVAPAAVRRRCSSIVDEREAEVVGARRPRVEQRVLLRAQQLLRRFVGAVDAGAPRTHVLSCGTPKAGSARRPRAMARGARRASASESRFVAARWPRVAGCSLSRDLAARIEPLRGRRLGPSAATICAHRPRASFSDRRAPMSRILALGPRGIRCTRRRPTCRCRRAARSRRARRSGGARSEQAWRIFPATGALAPKSARRCILNSAHGLASTSATSSAATRAAALRRDLARTAPKGKRRGEGGGAARSRSARRRSSSPDAPSSSAPAYTQVRWRQRSRRSRRRRSRRRRRNSRRRRCPNSRRPRCRVRGAGDQSAERRRSTR